MFEWLEKEMASIHTCGFHVIDGPPDERVSAGVTQSGVPLPFGYKQFVLKFGNAKLYRMSRSGYRVGVYAGPRESRSFGDSRVLCLGWHDGARVYIRVRSGPGEMPIFSFENRERKVADSFDEWLMRSCVEAKATYSRDEWEEVMRGPRAFTEEEQSLIRARQAMHWRVVGVDSEGNQMLEVTNAGSQTLGALTLGVRSIDGSLNGSVRLDVGDVAPGQKRILHVDCYKALVPAPQVQVFSLPDPRPEERAYYWEFRTERKRDP